MTKDKIFNWRFCLCCGLFLWFVVNLLQGIFTEIQEDEAYYHLWGEHLAWGYFDHPPMVGLMTFLSSHLFQGTLGVRFLTIVFSTLSLWVIWKIATYNANLSSPIDSRQPVSLHKNDMSEANSKLSTLNSQLFLIIACSVVMFNIYGFVTTPDSALILFSALFLLVYQHYLQDHSWKNALLMGLMMALMVYSKYHAFLLLGLVVLSNLKLLKDGKFWVACLVALALLMPHILWQVNADFPSFRYHLSQRSEPFRWSYFWEYLPNQLLIFNPFTFGAVVYVLFKHKPWIASSCLLAMTPQDGCDVIASEAKQSRERAPQEVFERGLCFVIIGFFFFFWLMAFRGHVEPHWTVVCMIPAVVLVYRRALIDKKLTKYIKRFVLPSLLLVLAVRILLLTPLADRFGYHGKEKHYKAIETVAGESPVAFQGSFQQPALYHYFTGNESSTLRSFYDRKTQYDLWQFDKAWTGHSVFVCGPVIDLSSEFRVGDVTFEGYLAEQFQSANRLQADFRLTLGDDSGIPVFHHGDTLWMDFAIHNPYPAPIDFTQSTLDMSLCVLFPELNVTLPCHYAPLPVLQPEDTCHGHLFAVVDTRIPVGQHVVTFAIGNRMALFAPERTTNAHDERIKIAVREKK